VNRADFDSLVEETSKACGAADIWRLESEDTSELNAALALAQSKMTAIKQSGKNPHFKAMYSTMVDVRASVTLPCAEHGLAITVQPLLVDGEWVARAVLRHKSGQWVAGFLPLMMGKRDMQAMKSAMTYAQRTLTIALTGAASGEDDDGNDAVAKPTKQQTSSSLAEKAEEALAAAMDVRDETSALKVLSRVKLRESEGAMPSGTVARFQKMFDDAFSEETVNG
jgi:hypothetical protein